MQNNRQIKLNKSVFALLLSLMTIVIISCTSDNTAGGGIDIANGYANIHCKDSLGNNVEGAEVKLTGVILTSSGDSSFYNKTLKTDYSGIVKFDKLPEGYYAAIVEELQNNTGAILSRISIGGDSSGVNKSITLMQKAPIKGRVANYSSYSNVSILVPGMPGSVTIDNEGFYSIENMFIGKYDICFVYDTIINYLNISVSNSIDDTIYIRDINFANSISEKSTSYKYYSDDFEKSYQIEPQYYAPQQKPAWYGDNKFDAVEYIKGDEDPKFIWRYPVLVGVSDTTLKHFGNDSLVIVTLIKDHIQKVSDNFNMADIDGIIEFSVDSIYFYNGTMTSETILTPEGFSVRLLYQAFKESNEGFASWITSSRVIQYAVSPSDSGGVFGDRGVRFLTALFGWSRGAYYMESMEIDSTLNEVNGEGYYLPKSVMTIDDYTNWSPTNTMVLNYTGNEMSPFADIVYERFPAVISLLFTDSLENPMSNVVVEIYGKQAGNKALQDSIAYSGITGINGEFSFSENPFVDIDTTQIHHNLLIRSINSGDTAYTWFPMNEVIDSCFIDLPSSYTKKIILQ